MQRSQEVSSVVEKAKFQLQKDLEDFEAAQHQVEEAEWALAAAKAREAELLLVIEASRLGVNGSMDQAQITSTCILSLEEELQRKLSRVKRKSGLKLGNARTKTKWRK